MRLIRSYLQAGTKFVLWFPEVDDIEDSRLYIFESVEDVMGPFESIVMLAGAARV